MSSHPKLRSSILATTVFLLLTITTHAYTTTHSRSTSSATIAFITRRTDPSLRLSKYDISFLDTNNQDDIEDEDDYDSEEEDDTDGPSTASRWESLHPKVKERIQRRAQERAIANKAKLVSKQDQKRQMYMHFKKQQRIRKKESYVQRPLPLYNRTLALADLQVGQVLPNATVISLTNFGAYLDVGTTCDGLLHVSQMSRETFVSHPREMLQPGDILHNQVRVYSVNPEKQKLQLTLLENNGVVTDDDSDEDRISLADIQVDDELWGIVKRVTHYGAYVEVGAVVDGFLHFMEHPEWHRNHDEEDASATPQRPSDLMQVGDRLRIWVSDVDEIQQRIKLTALRPSGLPGPRREFR